jgi:uncharacterized membrane-anchored protein
MRTRLAWLVVVLQVGVLAFMGGEREWILRTGRTVLLRTAPVDPRDPMRGDYVRFDFEIAHVPKVLCRDGALAWVGHDFKGLRELRDEPVFALIKRDEQGVAELVSVSDRRPASGEFLRGRVQYVDHNGLNVRFGVEAFFTEQGKAREFEEQQRQRPGVPLNIEAAVSGSGVAVLKGYRWEPLGITVTPDRPAPPNPPPAPGTPRPNPPPLTGITVQLKNHSDQPVAIVVRPNGGTFRLVPAERNMLTDQSYRWVGENVPPAKPTADMVRLLRPGETYQEHLDFSRPEWWLRDTKSKDGAQSIPWSNLKDAWGVMFRVEYAPTAKAETTGFPHAEVLRYGRLRSRAFGAMGGVD